MCLSSVEKTTRYIVDERLNIAIVSRSNDRQRRKWWSEDAEATKVPVEFTARALIEEVWPVQGSPISCHVDVFHSRMRVEAERRRVPSGIQTSDKVLITCNFAIDSLVRGFQISIFQFVHQQKSTRHIWVIPGRVWFHKVHHLPQDDTSMVRDHVTTWMLRNSCKPVPDM
jgi:hypothetical protein